MKINPSFDPIDKVWYTDNDIIAPTIRELLKLLPKNTIIPNYYPQGYNGKLYDHLSPQHKKQQNDDTASAPQNENTKKSFVSPVNISTITGYPIVKTKRIHPIVKRIIPDEKPPKKQPARSLILTMKSS